MNNKIIAKFEGSEMLHLTAKEEAKIYLAQVLTHYPEAIIEE